MVAFGRLLYSYICVCQMEHTGDRTCFVLHVSDVSISGWNLFYVACILCVKIHSHNSGNHGTAITYAIRIRRHIPPHSMLENVGYVQYSLVQHIN